MKKYLRRAFAFFGQKDEFDKITGELSRTVDKLEAYRDSLYEKGRLLMRSFEYHNDQATAHAKAYEDNNSEIAHAKRVQDKIAELLK